MNYRGRYKIIRKRFPHHPRFTAALNAWLLRDAIDWEEWAKDEH